MVILIIIFDHSDIPDFLFNEFLFIALNYMYRSWNVTLIMGLNLIFFFLYFLFLSTL